MKYCSVCGKPSERSLCDECVKKAYEQNDKPEGA